MRKTNADAAEAIAKQDEVRKRAARQAAAVAKSVAPEEIVTVRVLKLGADKISMGEHVAGIGEVHYERDEEFSCVLSTAQAYEERGWVEIKAA